MHIVSCKHTCIYESTVLSSIGAIVVDGKVYPSISPSANSVTYNEPQVEKQPSNSASNSPSVHTDSSVMQGMSSAVPIQQSSNVQQNLYQQVPLHLSQQQPQQQPQHMQQQSQSYMQQYAAPHNMPASMPPRSSPQAHQPRVPYNVNYNNRLQQPMVMHQQRPLTNCHQQQVTSSTHPQTHNLDQLSGQNTSLRGLLAHNPPPLPPPSYSSYRTSNHVPTYRLPPAYRYPPSGNPQRGAMVPIPPPTYQSANTPARLQQCNLASAPTQHMANYPMQHRWHIPQQANPCLPYPLSRHQPTIPNSHMPVPINDTYKITLRNQQANNNQKPCSNVSASSCDNPPPQNSSIVAGHAVSSSVPKTPSPGLPTPGKSDETEKSLDKFCQKSLNDLMLTIAKLDSNGIVVIPEAQRNQMDSTQVDSSTDEDMNSLTENTTGWSNFHLK